MITPTAPGSAGYCSHIDKIHKKCTDDKLKSGGVFYYAIESKI